VFSCARGRDPLFEGMGHRNIGNSFILFGIARISHRFLFHQCVGMDGSWLRFFSSSCFEGTDALHNAPTITKDMKKSYIVLISAIVVMGSLFFLFKNLPLPSFVPLAPTMKELKEAYKIEDINKTGHEQGIAIRPLQDGFLILGDTNSKGTGGYKIWLLQLAPSGNLLWDQTYGGYRGK